MTSGLPRTVEPPQAPVAAMPARQDFQLAAERPGVDLAGAQRAAGDFLEERPTRQVVDCLAARLRLAARALCWRPSTRA